MLDLSETALAVYETLNPHERARVLLECRRAMLRPNQRAPSGDWSIFGLLAGRGFGKTLAGAHWIIDQAMTNPESFSHVIAPTQSDLTKVIFGGSSGIFSILPLELVADYNKNEHQITLQNGSVIRGFSAEKPDRLRGPQCQFLWCDELAAWQRLQETWDMAMFGLRLGDFTKLVFTTTPKPVPLIRQLVSQANVPSEKTIITKGTTYDNRANLAPNFFKDLIKKYEGTLLGRQELEAELLNPEEQGVVKRSWLKIWPKAKPIPVLEFIVVSLDTAMTEKTRDKKSGKSDPTACTVWGTFRDGTREGILLLDCWQEWLGMPQLLERVPKEMSYRYGVQERPIIKPQFGPSRTSEDGRTPDLLIIEDKGSGISLRQMLERERIYAFPYNPGRADKLARLHAVAHIFANGMIYVPESSQPGREGEFISWAEPLISQLCSFTGEGSTEHDDFVDSLSQAIRYLIDRHQITVRPKPAVEDRDEDRDYRDRENPYG